MSKFPLHRRQLRVSTSNLSAFLSPLDNQSVHALHHKLTRNVLRQTFCVHSSHLHLKCHRPKGPGPKMLRPIHFNSLPLNDTRQDLALRQPALSQTSFGMHRRMASYLIMLPLSLLLAVYLRDGSWLLRLLINSIYRPSSRQFRPLGHLSCHLSHLSRHLSHLSRHLSHPSSRPSRHHR
jgi:hypothetical protein